MENFNNKIKYVYEKTKNYSHSERSFFNHLMGTSNIIKEIFPTQQYLIDAGLFHSIYGTCYYDFNVEIPRSEIKLLIGEKAENLVYIFCSIEERTKAILNNQFDKNIQKDLYILEYANLLEQGEDITIINRIKNNLFNQFNIKINILENKLSFSYQ